MFKKITFLSLAIGSMLISCKKGPGIGGQATIQGKVDGVLYDKAFNLKLDSGNVGNWTVNIVYGGDLGVDASQKTSYDGSYSFQYLRTGNYKVFVYSRARHSNLTDSALVQDVTITGKKQVINLPDYHIFR